MKNRISKVSIIAGAMLFSATAMAVPYSYVRWNSITNGASGSATGTITLPDSTTVGVTYSGEVRSGQTSAQGIFYWNIPTTYQSALIDNAPTTKDIITMVGGNSNVKTLTFSRPVTNLAMDILSFGRAGRPVSYTFNHDFSIQNNGPGYWGNGPLGQSSPNTLTGSEGHGVIMFADTMTSLSWTAPVSEDWYGFTVGVAGAVPEPSSLLALAGSMLILRRRRK
ncbi:MAG: PEP-CTERM sorting domain-containing protein [Armatimonadetes bacterium]|nr:PEP-CTERM sorting domain-containing protein [Armatimonadota bacterium]